MSAMPVGDTWLEITINGQPFAGRLSGVVDVSKAPDGKAVLHVIDGAIPHVTADQSYERVLEALGRAAKLVRL